MKLQPAMMFGEHMLLQREQEIPVWGRSVRGDVVTVTLGGQKQTTNAENGEWRVMFPPMEAAEHVTMTISSERTGENLVFRDVAIGEVWIAGGQSNMEFLLKYDEGIDQMCQTPDDPGFRYFRYPQANFTGCLEKEIYPDDGFWRMWTEAENRRMFSGPVAYMGRKLREALKVPVGFIGCNWGGTPASAWTAMEDLRANPALEPVLQTYRESCGGLRLAEYYEISDQPEAGPSPELQEELERIMMGIGLEEFFAKMEANPPRPEEMIYAPFVMGPRAAVRPAGLYETMLRKVAPYAARGVIWYQGEDDDARGWAGFFGESMKTLIHSWRKLWGRELPFLQVELAPFAGRGMTAAKDYPLIRRQQRQVMDQLDGVHNVCVMDAGDELNIHARNKRPAGERLARLARKYVYGEAELLADSPRFVRAERKEDQVWLYFSDCGDGLYLAGERSGAKETVQGDANRQEEIPGDSLEVTVDGKAVHPAVSVYGEALVLTDQMFADGRTIRIAFAEKNYCVDLLYNSAGLPAFPFTTDLQM